MLKISDAEDSMQKTQKTRARCRAFSSLLLQPWVAGNGSLNTHRLKQAKQKKKSKKFKKKALASAFTRNYAFAPRHSVGRAALRLSRNSKHSRRARCRAFRRFLLRFCELYTHKLHTHRLKQAPKKHILILLQADRAASPPRKLY